METISSRIENYIKFSYIKEFVNDLAYVYDKDEPLMAYKNFMEEINIFHDTEEFVKSFKNVFSGKHRAKYSCEGVYVNIPKFLSYNDENKETILDSLSKLNKIFKNFETECRELVFIKKHSEKIMNDIPENSDNSEDNIYLKQIMNTLKPVLQKTQDEFKEQNLDVERVVKIILIGIFDKVEMVQDDYASHIINILNIVAHTPLRNLASKQSELLREILSIRNLKSFPYKELINGSMGGFTS